MRTVKLFFLAVAFILPGSFLSAQKVTVNTEKSSVEWQGKKIGGEHTGEIKLKSGQLEIKNNTIVSGIFVIDMTTITNTDLSDENYNAKLVGHLKSDDFFGVEEFPTATFVVSKASKFVNGKAQVSGDLTIKGNTESISFEVIQENKAYKAKVEVDRSKFDVRYGSKSFFKNIGDKAINDIFTLDISLVI